MRQAFEPAGGPSLTDPSEGEASVTSTNDTVLGAGRQKPARTKGLNRLLLSIGVEVALGHLLY